MDRFELADAALASSTAAKHAQIASNNARLAEEDAAKAVDCADDPELAEEYAASALTLAGLAVNEAKFAAKLAKRAERILLALYIENALLEEDEND